MTRLIFYYSIFFVISQNCGSAQTVQSSEFEPSRYFYFIGNELNYHDSLFDIHETRVVEKPSAVTWPRTNISEHVRIKLIQGNFIEVDMYGDSLILYKQGKSFEEMPWKYKYYGQFVKGDSVLFISDLPLYDDYGNYLTNEDSTEFIYPSAYNVVPHGFWYCQIDDTKYETGYYEKGKKVGVWSTYSSIWNTVASKVILEEKIYKNGLIINHVIQNKISNYSDENKLEKAIEGKWYNTGWYHSDKEKCIEGYCIYIFSRDSSKFINSGMIILDKLYLKSNGTFDKVSQDRCGTEGNYNESHRRKEWHVTEEMDLFLDGGTYNLVFLNEETMVLTFKLKKTKKGIFKK
jgi:hypothetical protein